MSPDYRRSKRAAHQADMSPDHGRSISGAQKTYKAEHRNIFFCFCLCLCLCLCFCFLLFLYFFVSSKIDTSSNHPAINRLQPRNTIRRHFAPLVHRCLPSPLIPAEACQVRQCLPSPPILAMSLNLGHVAQFWPCPSIPANFSNSCRGLPVPKGQ
jgi:hypothetical protein